jgi:hypothetical protein
MQTAHKGQKNISSKVWKYFVSKCTSINYMKKNYAL